MNKYLLSLMVILPLSSFVFAQDSEDEEVEEVVVTGYKSSLKDAIDIKRKNVGVVDALTAEDLGKFPDGNLAEAEFRKFLAGCSELSFASIYQDQFRKR